MNVHTKPRLTLETYGHSGQKPRARPGPARYRARAIPCKVGVVTGHLVGTAAKTAAIAADGARPAWTTPECRPSMGTTTYGAGRARPTLTEQIGVGLCSVEARDELLLGEEAAGHAEHRSSGAAMGLRIRLTPLKSRRGWATLSQPLFFTKNRLDSTGLGRRRWTCGEP